MYNYYRYSPRGFANEDIIYAVNTDVNTEVAFIENIQRICAEDPTPWCNRINRDEARKITAANRKAYRDGIANYCNPAGATEITLVKDVLLYDNGNEI